jgi:hypothetical protein
MFLSNVKRGREAGPRLGQTYTPRTRSTDSSLRWRFGYPERRQALAQLLDRSRKAL